ncbi:MAG: hypothetical protein JNN12_10335 [Bacteroidetes Order II. Incertae sedis bacterium]|nr:hypothetical protein [Bacteroidetes Order II. bacterium]
MNWVVTDDPLKITFETQKCYMDLGAEKNMLIADQEDK